MATLAAWIGIADLQAAERGDEADVGPIAQALSSDRFDHALLLADHEPHRVQSFTAWLSHRTSATIHIERVSLSSPTDFAEIYRCATAVLDQHLQHKAGPADLTFHLSPGTPAMAAIWLILGKTKYPAQFIQSSRQRGVEAAPFPFDLAAELVPSYLRQADRRLEELSEMGAPSGGRFGDIIYRSDRMTRLVARAERAALRAVPILIEGESGTGKELLAKAVHAASPRSGRPLRVVNCGAIPDELVEAELFGHERGAFTGATHARPGYFEDAEGGTLFLDEVGELPLRAQVKLLRVLQEGAVTRVGATRARRIDVRIIAATNRDLMAEVAEGRFREDLFFRLAVLILKVPPLRDREGDVGLLADGLLNRINDANDGQPGYHPKTLSAAAKNLILRHNWPGNVRELQNTLQRAAVWSEGDVLGVEDIRDALLPLRGGEPAEEPILGRSMAGGIDLKALMSLVARHYLTRAIEEAQGNKTKAAELLGMPSYQTLTNWLERYGAERVGTRRAQGRA